MSLQNSSYRSSPLVPVMMLAMMSVMMVFGLGACSVISPDGSTEVEADASAEADTAPTTALEAEHGWTLVTDAPDGLDPLGWTGRFFLATASNGDWYRSSTGEAWELLTDAPGLIDPAFAADLGTERVVVAGAAFAGGHEGWESTDHGSTWSPLGSIEADGVPRRVEVAVAGPAVTVLWVTDGDGRLDVTHLGAGGPGSPGFVTMAQTQAVAPAGTTLDRVELTSALLAGSDVAGFQATIGFQGNDGRTRWWTSGSDDGGETWSAPSVTSSPPFGRPNVDPDRLAPSAEGFLRLADDGVAVSTDGRWWSWLRLPIGSGQITEAMAGSDTIIAVMGGTLHVHPLVLPEATDGDSAGGSGGDEQVAPPGDPVDVTRLRQRLSLTTLIVGPDRATVDSPGGTGPITVYRDGTTATIEASAESWAWADRSYVYVDNREVYHHDGQLVCTIETGTGASPISEFATIHHAAQRDDGTLVVALSGWGEAWAYDCDGADHQPIEPMSRTGEDGEYEYTERVAGRTFVAQGDAEGNTTSLVDESGTNMIGDDYPGLVVHRDDGAVIVYTDQTEAVSPHFSNRVRIRETAQGELIGDFTAADIVCSLHPVDGDRVVVVSHRAAGFSGECDPERIELITTEGSLLDTVDITGVEVLYAR